MILGMDAMRAACVANAQCARGRGIECDRETQGQLQTTTAALNQSTVAITNKLNANCYGLNMRTKLHFTQFNWRVQWLFGGEKSWRTHEIRNIFIFLCSS